MADTAQLYSDLVGGLGNALQAALSSLGSRLTVILETRAPQATADVVRVARDRFGALCEVEPLFPTAAPDAFFLARLPGLRFADLPRSPYAQSYAARDRDGFSGSRTQGGV